MRIYITHPYGRRNGLSDEELELNVLIPISIARELILKGHNPYIPNLFHYVHKGWNDSPNEDRYFHIVSEWIQFCDALLYTKPSDGCDRELRIAQGLGKKIYRSVDEIE